jgi:hypothetical protein
MKRRAWIAGVALVIAAVVPAGAYLKIGTRVGTRTESLRWRQFPIRYFISDVGVNGVTPQQFQAAVDRAFTTWHGVENVDISAQFAGFVQASPGSEDGASVIGFLNRPSQDRTLAATTFTVDVTDGRVLESDIFFNSIFGWSTAQAGDPSSFDVESIALHETGHMLGLSHSALGETELIAGGRRVIAAESVMFPIAFSRGNIADRTLKADDISGITDIYGGTAANRLLGSISGRVTKNGRGVQGAHVVAFNPQSGTLVGGFTLDSNGAFVIAALRPGPYILRAEPLDDGDLNSFFDSSFDVDLDFKVTFHDHAVVVPRGGGVRDIEIKVVPK